LEQIVLKKNKIEKAGDLFYYEKKISLEKLA
jgi:hypothetical protein